MDVSAASVVASVVETVVVIEMDANTVGVTTAAAKTVAVDIMALVMAKEIDRGRSAGTTSTLGIQG